MKSMLKSLLKKLCVRIGENAPLLIDWKGVGDCERVALLLDSMRLSKTLLPKVENAPSNQKIVVFAPHPDDEVIGMGGTLIKMIENKCDVHVIFFTLKDNPDIFVESKKSAKHNGFEYTHLEFQRRSIPTSADALAELKTLLIDLKPDSIFLPFMLDDHEDHRLCSDVLASLAPSLQKSKINPEIWAYQVYTALPLNTVINISDVIERKKDAIRVYKSCFKSRDWAHFAAGLNAFNVRFMVGDSHESYAEVFCRTSMSKYLKMHATYKGGSND